MNQELVLSDIDPAGPARVEDLELAASVGEVGSPDLPVRWELKALKTRHKHIASLVVQGMKNTEVARLTGVTKEYVSMLMRQPLVQMYMQELVGIADQRLEAMTVKSVDVIAEVMESGSEKGKLQAARMQLEATKRIGRPDPMRGQTEDTTGRLEKLAERLIALQAGVRQPGVFNSNGQEIIDVPATSP